LKYLAAPSIAPPNLGPMVKRPVTKHEIKSFPALAVTRVLWAPLTAGPWSATVLITVSIKSVAHLGKRFLNQSRVKTSATENPVSGVARELMG